MIKFFYRGSQDKTLKSLKQSKKGSWVYVEDPSLDEIELISQEFDLDQDLLTDATDVNEVPRLEVESNAIYIYTSFPLADAKRTSLIPLLLILKNSNLITLSIKEPGFMDKIFSDRVHYTTTKPNQILLEILHQISLDFTSQLNKISKRIRSSITNLEKITNKDIIQFVSYESMLNEFLSDLIPTNSIINTLLANRNFKFTEDERDLLEDIKLSNNQLIELSKANLKTIVNIREAYSTIMTNNLNRVIKLFTSLTVLLTIPTIIASIYGMNVQLPFADQSWVFAGIIGLIILILAGLSVIFIRNEWL